ncbi:uncharacterized protein N7483_007420 [Penicillium malachiteum]|uniref:uncharacterized protein n=1 Tax=Penicillium malachiteum TaxID=1324776 RepID=UPI002547A0A8|nr:uncharacterized protein N7483_007420 [Penicillium malachiteum]KAJ5726063.1 hypothetical protein N7483_007420 [Penicillium malachiteum]
MLQPTAEIPDSLPDPPPRSEKTMIIIDVLPEFEPIAALADMKAVLQAHHSQITELCSSDQAQRIKQAANKLQSLLSMQTSITA